MALLKLFSYFVKYKYVNDVSRFKEYMSDSFTNYNYVEKHKSKCMDLKNLCQQMHIKRDISNWNIKIILSDLIGAGNPELLSTICMLSTTI